MDEFPFTLEDAMKAADSVRQICNEESKEEQDAAARASSSSSSWDAAVEDRTYYPQKQFPPGAMEGVAAAVFSGLVVFSPFRNAILRQARKSSRSSSSGGSGKSSINGGGGGPASSSGFSDFVDLLIAPLLAVGVVQVGLATASLVGSQVYLSEVADVPPTAPSPMTDLICSELLLIPKENGMDMSSSSSSSTTTPSSSGLASSSSSWDPRVQTLYSLSRAIDNCQERNRQQTYKSMMEDSKQNSLAENKTSVWSKFFGGKR